MSDFVSKLSKKVDRYSNANHVLDTVFIKIHIKTYARKIPRIKLTRNHRKLQRNELNLQFN